MWEEEVEEVCVQLLITYSFEPAASVGEIRGDLSKGTVAIG